MSDAKPPKLSYDTSTIPKPATNQDVYYYAMLIEQRLMRMALEKIASALEDQASTSASAAKRPK